MLCILEQSTVSERLTKKKELKHFSKDLFPMCLEVLEQHSYLYSTMKSKHSLHPISQKEKEIDINQNH